MVVVFPYAVAVGVAARDDIRLVEESIADLAGHERAQAVEVGSEDFEQLRAEVSNAGGRGLAVGGGTSSFLSGLGWSSGFLSCLAFRLSLLEVLVARSLSWSLAGGRAGVALFAPFAACWAAGFWGAMSCGLRADEAEVTEAVDAESLGVFWRVVRDEAGKCSFGSMRAYHEAGCGRVARRGKVSLRAQPGPQQQLAEREWRCDTRRACGEGVAGSRCAGVSVQAGKLALTDGRRA